MTILFQNISNDASYVIHYYSEKKSYHYIYTYIFLYFFFIFVEIYFYAQKYILSFYYLLNAH